MKITCNREKLENAFSMVALVVKSQSPKPILRNIKLEARENEIVLFATDMEMGIRISLPCDQVQEPGCVVLPNTRVANVLKESQDEFITIESDGTRTQILGEIRFAFSTEDPEEFPGTPMFEEKQYLVTKARYIKEGIRRTIFATDNESGRYALGGVFMDYSEGFLNFVSTDGRRMAVQQVEAACCGDFPEQKSAIATVRSLQLLDRLLTKGDADVSVALLENQILVQTENLFFYASLLEGRFPSWRAGMGQLRNPETIVLPMGLFFPAIRAAGVVTENNAPGVVLAFGNGQMTITANHPENGRIEKSFPVEFSGEERRLKLSQIFISAFLRTLGDDTLITMNYVDSRTGVMFSTNDGYRYLVMPMQLDEEKKNAPVEETAANAASAASAAGSVSAAAPETSEYAEKTEDAGNVDVSENSAQENGAEISGGPDSDSEAF